MTIQIKSLALGAFATALALVAVEARATSVAPLPAPTGLAVPSATVPDASAEYAEQVAGAYFEAFMTGQIGVVLGLSETPFAFDRVDVVVEASELRERMEEGVGKKGIRTVPPYTVEHQGLVSEIVENAVPASAQLVQIMIEDEGILLALTTGDQPRVIGLSD